jgi:hypothetical protein
MTSKYKYAYAYIFNVECILWRRLEFLVIFIFKKERDLGVVVYACNPSTHETVAGRLQVPRPVSTTQMLSWRGMGGEWEGGGGGEDLWNGIEKLKWKAL